jgi:hypothetical protein
VDAETELTAPSDDGSSPEAASPRVTGLSWGRLEVEGPGGSAATRRFKDAKLWPGGARAWDWRETGTEHEPGIQPADVEELLDHGATVIVLSRGMLGRLGVMPETLQLLESRGVRSEIAQTEEAVRLYNELRDRERVAALFHTTC